MLDGVSLDQLRTFIAAVDEGSFSAAARKLLRAQSVVSETVSNLEEQIGVPLFDRSGRYPKLTRQASCFSPNRLPSRRSGQCSSNEVSADDIETFIKGIKVKDQSIGSRYSDSKFLLEEVSVDFKKVLEQLRGDTLSGTNS